MIRCSCGTNLAKLGVHDSCLRNIFPWRLLLFHWNPPMTLIVLLYICSFWHYIFLLLKSCFFCFIPIFIRLLIHILSLDFYHYHSLLFIIVDCSVFDLFSLISNRTQSILHFLTSPSIYEDSFRTWEGFKCTLLSAIGCSNRILCNGSFLLGSSQR